MCERIKGATSEELEQLLAKSLVLQFHEVIALRRRAYLEAMKGKFKDARQAFQSYTELCKLEQDLRPGAEGRGGEGDILLVVRKIYQQRRKIGDGKRVVREAAAEILPTDGESEGVKKAANKPATARTGGKSGLESGEMPIEPPRANLGAVQDDAQDGPRETNKEASTVPKDGED